MSNIIGKKSAKCGSGRFRTAEKSDALFLAACKNTGVDGRYLPIWNDAASDGDGYEYAKQQIEKATGADSYKNAFIIEDGQGNPRYGFYFQDPNIVPRPERNDTSELSIGFTMIYNLARKNSYTKAGDKKGSFYLGSFACAAEFIPSPKTDGLKPSTKAPAFMLPVRSVFENLQTFAAAKNAATIWGVVIERNTRAKTLWNLAGMSLTGDEVKLSATATLQALRMPVEYDDEGAGLCREEEL